MLRDVMISPEIALYCHELERDAVQLCDSARSELSESAVTSR
jgi:hypothetical protein